MRLTLKAEHDVVWSIWAGDRGELSCAHVNREWEFHVKAHELIGAFLSASLYVSKRGAYYGCPLSVSGRPCYILPIFYFIYLFFLWPPYSPSLVNGGSRKFYTWWTLSVIEEVTTWIFLWSSLNYRVGQKVTKFRIFSDPARKLSALTPERGRIL